MSPDQEALSRCAAAAGWVEVLLTPAGRSEWRHGRWSVVVVWSGTGQLVTACLTEHTVIREHVSCVRHPDPVGAVRRWLTVLGGGS